MNHPAHAYRQFSVQGTSPLGLVVMLYDGAIAAFERANTAIEVNNIEGKCKHLNRALAVIAQLEGTLNFELGGEVAQNLKCLYLYARAQAQKSNVENSPEILRSLIQQFATVREAWYQADHQPSASLATPPKEPSHPESRYQMQYRGQPSSSTTVSEDSPYASSPAPDSGSWRVSA